MIGVLRVFNKLKEGLYKVSKKKNVWVDVDNGIGYLIIEKKNRKGEYKKFSDKYLEIELESLRYIDKRFDGKKFFKKIYLVVVDDRDVRFINLRSINNKNGGFPLIVYLERYGELINGKYKIEYNNDESFVKIFGRRFYLNKGVEKVIEEVKKVRRFLKEEMVVVENKEMVKEEENKNIKDGSNEEIILEYIYVRKSKNKSYYYNLNNNWWYWYSLVTTIISCRMPVSALSDFRNHKLEYSIPPPIIKKYSSVA